MKDMKSGLLSPSRGLLHEIVKLGKDSFPALSCTQTCLQCVRGIKMIITAAS